MQDKYVTDRLILKVLELEDAEFINQLVNSPPWIRFIGEKNIKSNEEAKKYIQDIRNNPNFNYWTVRLKDQNTPIGLVTFMKRDYFDYYDIGYALLEQFTKRGFAYEAVSTILSDIIHNHVHHKFILAKTFKDNDNSIKLLKKLGLELDNEIENSDNDALVYAASIDKLSITYLTNTFFNLFSNSGNRSVNLDELYKLCISEALIIKIENDKKEIFNIDAFIEPRQTMLSDGSLTDFKEYELYEETTIVGNLAQRISKYQKSGYLNGCHFQTKGHKIFQYLKTKAEWKISSISWEDEI